ncbi:hypothetical protein TNCV_3216181 [Trichonephila clavipes]|nr:hypothetical protein TNCV_3216181 [Trichonephila clavipes]
MLGRQVAGRNYPSTNKNTLIRALTEEWDKLPQQLLDNVVQKLKRGRCLFIKPQIYQANWVGTEWQFDWWLKRSDFTPLLAKIRFRMIHCAHRHLLLLLFTARDRYCVKMIWMGVI